MPDVSPLAYTVCDAAGAVLSQHFTQFEAEQDKWDTEHWHPDTLQRKSIRLPLQIVTDRPWY